MSEKVILIKNDDRLGITLVSKGLKPCDVFIDYKTNQVTFLFKCSRLAQDLVRKCREGRSWITERTYSKELEEFNEFLCDRASSDQHYLNKQIKSYY